MKPLVIYQRVSTKDQDFQSQVDDLKKWAKENNFSVAMMPHLVRKYLDMMSMLKELSMKK